MEQSPPTPESDWWARSVSGDGGAFAALFDRHSDRVFRHTYALLSDVQDAEDATAAVFFELWRKRATVRVINGSVLPWLLVTASNTARNLNRSRRRYQALLRSLPHGDSTGSAEEQAMLGLSVADTADPSIVSVLRGMPTVDYLLLTMTTIEDFSVSEAAEAAGISSSAARTRLSRAKARLREAIPHRRLPMAEETS